MTPPVGHMTSPDWLVMQSVTNYISLPQATTKGLAIVLIVLIKEAVCSMKVSWQQPLHRRTLYSMSMPLIHSISTAEE